MKIVLANPVNSPALDNIIIARVAEDSHTINVGQTLHVIPDCGEEPLPLVKAISSEIEIPDTQILSLYGEYPTLIAWRMGPTPQELMESLHTGIPWHGRLTTNTDIV